VEALMARVYVSGSIRDQQYVQHILDRLRAAGHVITHDWTQHKGAKMDSAEALRQLHGVWECELLVVKIHPRLKAGWMELGAAISHNVPCYVIPHPDVSESMWYTLPSVHMADEFDSLEAAVRELT
jgi:hypothetical protein